MYAHRIRNLIPLVYAVMIIAGFVISPIVGVAVCIVGGALSGVLWSALSGSGGGGASGRARDRGDRAGRPGPPGARSTSTRGR